MSILYDEGQQAIATESRRVLEARTDKARLLGLIEQVGRHDEPFWQTAVEQGWTALAIPEQHGGLGLGLVELGLVAQACGAATAGAPFLTGSYGVAHALAAGIDPALAAEWLPRLASGDATGCVALAEGNAALPNLAAVTFADGRLSGTKRAVSGGLSAAVGLIWASCDGSPVLALADLAGAGRSAVDSYDNARLYADLEFAGTPARLVAKGDVAQALALDVLARLAVVTAHEQLGGAEALLHAARDFAVTRKAFGQPIGAFQSIKHRISEIYALVEIARANCIHAASSEGGEGFLLAAADARISATEAYDTASRDCVQIHGGIGVTWELGLHLHMRRARSLAVEQGNLLFWEDLLVSQLTGDKA
ncbi:alkylation response protein AidB-like acyl-CoA dehydrogenase [Novosphingobium kunmingense]|uniref:Alkylation response protein AidB-like acyl-CoA dehydrogenase n=1 Tax=Novosphingobium kunmingense TaxID=1211806 RepID=A0A2N0H5Z1_9SPHN|nr:acyl-CoA dehydrogenase family protein [Novosphingobium kunmingense]PKB14332.1 alkylation response protein AidB-like acyl-CoA dehydrogenase [Novosphingobium kunmingense]